MRRLILTTTTCGVVLAFAPAAALASHHHNRHHSRHHARVHHRAHVRRFGDLTTTPSTSTGQPGSTASEAVGTVDSFTNGVLTIKLNDGSTVSGAVTGETELECEAAEPADSSTIHEDGDGGGDHSGSGDDNGSGGDDQGDDDQGENNQTCTTANLAPGASVRGAELKLSSGGAVWDKIDLIL